MKKRLLSWTMALAMCLSLLPPVTAKAEYPVITPEEAESAYGFSLSTLNVEFGDILPDTSVERQEVKITNTGDKLMAVEIEKSGGAYYTCSWAITPQLEPGQSVSYYLEPAVRDGDHVGTMRFHVTYGLEVRWDHIGNGSFGQEVAGTHFYVEAPTVHWNRVSEQEYTAEDWLSVGGLTGGALQLGSVQQSVSKDETFEGDASFTLTNISSRRLHLSIYPEVGDQHLYIERHQGEKSYLDSGETGTYTVHWTYYARESGLPNALQDSKLIVDATPEHVRQTTTIPLAINFSGSDSYELFVSDGGGKGKILNEQGVALEKSSSIPSGGMTVRFQPNPGYYLENVSINSVQQGPIDSYRFENVTEKQTISCTFKELAERPIPLYLHPDDPCVELTANYIRTTSVKDAYGNPHKVYVYPAGTWLMCHRAGWGYIKDVDREKENKKKHPHDYASYSCHYAYGGMLDESLPQKRMNGNWACQLPSNRTYEYYDTYFMFDSKAKTQAPNDAPASWAKAGVEKAIAAGIVPASLQYAYNMPITRAEFCALATQLYETKCGYIGARKHFDDTTDVNVEKMAALGVVDGVGNGKFAPTGELSREQAATMLARLAEAMGHPLEAAQPSFKGDGKTISNWAAAAVGQMQKSGIMGGVSKDRFAPKVAYSREQSILTALRLSEVIG